MSGDATKSLTRVEKAVRSKMVSAWNNIKYGRTMFKIELKTSFSESTPVWILGKPYHRSKPRQEDESMPKSEIMAFESDFSSRIWFTYRSDLRKFSGTDLTTDCGWGCMIRTGQMMMAQGLVMHWLGREWRTNKQPADNPTPSPDRQTSVKDRIHRDILRLFSDVEISSPLSIHNLVRLGRNIGKGAGNWFGPASVAYLMQLAVANFQEYQSLVSNLAVYVAQDCTVYKEDIVSMCTVSRVPKETVIQDFAVLETPTHLDTMQYSFSEEVIVEGESWCFEEGGSLVPDPNWKPLVIFIPVRLGGERFNPLYSSCLRSLLTLPSSLGWIGGRPTHSLYFLGFQEDDLIHLDPHRLQPAVDTTGVNFPTHSYHSSAPRKISISKMDPSCCLGFYIRTRDEFECWCQGIEEFATPSPVEGRSQYPIFSVAQGRGDGVGGRGEEGEWSSLPEETETQEDIQSEDFVFL